MARDDDEVARGRAARMVETSFILMMVLLKGLCRATGTNEGVLLPVRAHEHLQQK